MTSGVPTVVRVVNRGVAANTYICGTASPSDCILIDPGLDTEAIEAALDESHLTPRAIFCTHGHFDHVGAAEHFRRKYEVDLYLHDADARVARAANFTLMALKMPWRIAAPESFVSLDEGTVWGPGDTRVDVLHVPGHTPGSVILLVDGRAFTGDTLYRDDVWLGSMPESDDDRLVESLHRLWALLPEDTSVHPGHGQGATFGEIRQSNVRLRDLLGVAGPPRA